MASAQKINPTLIDTGSEILAGFSRHPANNTWRGFSHNWNLLLVVKGEVNLKFGEKQCVLPVRSLNLIAPAGVRNFSTNVPWECHWIHFDRNLYLDDTIEWKEIIPGVQNLKLETSDYRIMHHLFLQVEQIAIRREHCWKQVLYCLIREIILRGNTAGSRALANFDTELAQKMLSNLQENLSMTEIASRCGLSRSAFFAKFSDAFGLSPRKYREICIMRNIQGLLETTDLNISEICEYVHMSTPFYLSNRFKAYCGLSPQAYRRRFRQDH